MHKTYVHFLTATIRNSLWTKQEWQTVCNKIRNPYTLHSLGQIVESLNFGKGFLFSLVEETEEETEKNAVDLPLFSKDENNRASYNHRADLNKLSDILQQRLKQLKRNSIGVKHTLKTIKVDGFEVKFPENLEIDHPDTISLINWKDSLSQHNIYRTTTANRHLCVVLSAKQLPKSVVNMAKGSKNDAGTVTQYKIWGDWAKTNGELPMQYYLTLITNYVAAKQFFMLKAPSDEIPKPICNVADIITSLRSFLEKKKANSTIVVFSEWKSAAYCLQKLKMSSVNCFVIAFDDSTRESRNDVYKAIKSIAQQVLSRSDIVELIDQHFVDILDAKDAGGELFEDRINRSVDIIKENLLELNDPIKKKEYEEKLAHLRLKNELVEEDDVQMIVSTPQTPSLSKIELSQTQTPSSTSKRKRSPSQNSPEKSKSQKRHRNQSAGAE